MLAQKIVDPGADLGRKSIVSDGGDDPMSGRVPPERWEAEQESSRPSGDGSKEAHGTFRINDPLREKRLKIRKAPPVMAGINRYVPAT